MAHVLSGRETNVISLYNSRNFLTFLLGIVLFTLFFHMDSLIKLMELVVISDVPVADVCKIILYLIQSAVTSGPCFFRRSS